MYRQLHTVMATTWRNKQTFTATINGTNYYFRCHTTSTRSGFCHTCWCDQLNGLTSKSDTTKISYYNRTWERFDYESVLNRAIDKFPKNMQAELREQIIERTARGEKERCDALFGKFKALHDGLTEHQKDVLSGMPPMQNEEDVRRTMGIMGIFNLLNA